MGGCTVSPINSMGRISRQGYHMLAEQPVGEIAGALGK